MEKNFPPSLHCPSLLSLMALCLLEIKEQFTTKYQGLHVELMKHRDKVKTLQEQNEKYISIKKN